jgi:Ca2+/H+ antiporter, TMEM165/GDT1 family
MLVCTSAVPLIALLVLLGNAHAQETSESAEKPSDNSLSNFSFAAFSRAFGEAFAVILATEIGDRTFFIAAIMAMRHSRLIIWTGAVGALVVMTVLSTLVGHVAPLLISRTYTQYAAAGLFFFFGIKMLRSGLSIDHSGASDELEEVERELTKKEEDTPADEESVPDKQDSKKDQETPNKVLMQAFTLTFLAEWGDRSQIATIALVRPPARASAHSRQRRPPTRTPGECFACASPCLSSPWLLCVHV